MDSTLIQKGIVTFYSFYDHNALVFYLGLIFLMIVVRMFMKPSKYYVLLAVGFLILIFSFEYQKHFIPHFFSHLLNPIVDSKTHARTYKYSSLFLSRIFPMLLDFLGWFLVVVALLFSEKFLDKKGQSEFSESKILELKSKTR